MGPAGTGKTTTLRALRTLWEQQYGCPPLFSGDLPGSAWYAAPGDELVSKDAEKDQASERPHDYKGTASTYGQQEDCHCAVTQRDDDRGDKRRGKAGMR